MPHSFPMPHLYYFRPHEFGEWYERMDPRLLVLLDSFRHRWGAQVKISPVKGALGRTLGTKKESQHNVERWGTVRAVDTFPRGLETKADAARALRFATETGFTGVGIYPQWDPSVGIHFDVRRGAAPGAPATWGAVDHHDGERWTQKYVSWDYATAKLPED